MRLLFKSVKGRTASRTGPDPSLRKHKRPALPQEAFECGPQCGESELHLPQGNTGVTVPFAGNGDARSTKTSYH
jgi:hypothetical protein